MVVIDVSCMGLLSSWSLGRSSWSAAANLLILADLCARVSASVTMLGNCAAMRALLVVLMVLGDGMGILRCPCALSRYCSTDRPMPPSGPNP